MEVVYETIVNMEELNTLRTNIEICNARLKKELRKASSTRDESALDELATALEIEILKLRNFKPRVEFHRGDYSQ